MQQCGGQRKPIPLKAFKGVWKSKHCSLERAKIFLLGGKSRLKATGKGATEKKMFLL